MESVYTVTRIVGSNPTPSEFFLVLDMIHVRKAVLSDAISLVPLLSQLGYLYTLEQVQSRLQVYLEPYYYSVFVASSDNQLVGLIALSFSFGFVSDLKRCRVEGLIVDKQWRLHGIGKQLLAQAEAEASDRGCTLIELTSGMHRKKDGSHDFYHALGYQNEGAHAKLYLRKQINF